MDKNTIAAVLVAIGAMFMFVVFGPEFSSAMKHGGRIQGSWYPVSEDETERGDKIARRVFCRRSLGTTVISEKKISMSFGRSDIPLWHLKKVHYGKQEVRLDLKLVRHRDRILATFDYIDETQLKLRSWELVPSEPGPSQALLKTQSKTRDMLSNLRRC